MLKINLLPESARQATLSHLEQLHRTPLMWIALSMMIAIPVSLFLPANLSSHQLAQLTAKLGVLEPRKAEVDRLQQLLQRLRVQEAAFRDMGRGQGVWSKRLNVLSNVTPSGVWFTDLSLDQTTGLVIQGSAVAQRDPEMVNVTKFVRELEADPDFAAAVKNIQIESIKRVLDGDIEIVQFTLTCSLIQPTTP